jgi:para-nitrobenzyl esterase
MLQPPGPQEPWDGVFNATKAGNRCPQVTIDLGNKTDIFDYSKASDTEDCLYISIYSPMVNVKLKGNKILILYLNIVKSQPVEGLNLPVLFFVHGGGFVSGSGLAYEGYKWMDYDIVVAVPNYRLGPFGNMTYLYLLPFVTPHLAVHRFPFVGH